MMFHGWSCLSCALGSSLLLCNVVNWVNVRYTGVVCQYVVFILKLIWSYLPVHLTYSLQSAPLSLLADVEELSENGWVSLGLPRVAARQQVTSISSQ